MRGIGFISAVTIAAEVGDLRRFQTARFHGLHRFGHSEHSSGQTRRQGGITNTGNVDIRTSWCKLPTTRGDRRIAAGPNANASMDCRPT